MNRLKHMMFYEIGPIDDVPDMGVSWRKYMGDFLHGLGIGVLNPCDKPTNNDKETPETYAMLDNWAKNGEYDKLTHFMKG